VGQLSSTCRLIAGVMTGAHILLETRRIIPQ
jgi:hypothetical protein